MAHFEDEYAGTDAKFSYEDYTHPMRSTVGKMPWHTDDKPFGVTQEEFEKSKLQLLTESALLLDSESITLRTGKPKRFEYCHCGEKGSVYLDRWYCWNCWNALGDD
jgi:hypothetical protein